MIGDATIGLPSYTRSESNREEGPEYPTIFQFWALVRHNANMTALSAFAKGPDGLLGPDQIGLSGDDGQTGCKYGDDCEVQRLPFPRLARFESLLRTHIGRTCRNCYSGLSQLLQHPL